MKKFISKNKHIILVISSVTLIIISFLFFSDEGILKYYKSYSELNRLRLEIKKTDKEIDSLKLVIDSLKFSNRKLEATAREKYNMKLEGEAVFRIIEE